MCLYLVISNFTNVLLHTEISVGGVGRSVQVHHIPAAVLHLERRGLITLLVCLTLSEASPGSHNPLVGAWSWVLDPPWVGAAAEVTSRGVVDEVFGVDVYLHPSRDLVKVVVLGEGGVFEVTRSWG